MTVTVTVEGPQRWPDCVTYEEHTCICRYVSSRCCHIFFRKLWLCPKLSFTVTELDVYCLIVTVTVTMCYQAHAHIHVISPMTR